MHCIGSWGPLLPRIPEGLRRSSDRRKGCPHRVSLVSKLEPVQATVSLSRVCACLCMGMWLWFFISIHTVPASSAALKWLQQCHQSPLQARRPCTDSIQCILYSRSRHFSVVRHRVEGRNLGL